MSNETRSIKTSQNAHTSSSLTLQKPPIVLTIATSDSGGGAGIQADIKAISATGSYACSVIAALTAQNTLGVSDIYSIPLPHIASQLDAVFSDIPVDAVKIGMLANAENIELVAEKLRQYQPKWVVLDPVMVATSGDTLLAANAIGALKEALMPLADVITPNLPEAAALVGEAVPENEAAMFALIEKVRRLKAKSVLIKGGHLQHEPRSRDILVCPEGERIFNAPRVLSQNTHGTGCSLSSAIASYLAQGQPLAQAILLAKSYLTQAIDHSARQQIGQGHGPVDHFFHLRSPALANDVTLEE